MRLVYFIFSIFSAKLSDHTAINGSGPSGSLDQQNHLRYY